MQNIRSSENYESLVFRKNVYRHQLLLALDEVKKYIIEKQLILTGGMAIDLALRKKGSKLYEEDALPDYDFYSPDFQDDAYEIGRKLCEMKLDNISVINAAHPTTMRVRVNYEAVADITYIPRNIYEKIPTIRNRDGVIFEDPHYKMINIHIALSYPYANSPFDVILQRFDKDMKRFDILYELYPISDIKDQFGEKMVKCEIPKSLLKNACISGFPALDYWKCQVKPGSWKENIEKIKFSIPESASIVIISDDVEKTKQYIENEYKNSKMDFQNYNPLLDTIPGKISVIFPSNTRINTPKKIDILDNRGKLVAAKYNGDFHVANLQFIMSQFLAKYILYDELDEYKHKYIWGYLKCFELVKNASDKLESHMKKMKNIKIEDFLPTYEVFGDCNISASNIVMEHKILERIGQISPLEFPERPLNIYPNIENNCRIDNKVKKFIIDKSWVYCVDGLARKLPLQFINC